MSSLSLAILDSERLARPDVRAASTGTPAAEGAPGLEVASGVHPVRELPLHL